MQILVGIFSCRQSHSSSKKDSSGFFPIAFIASSISSFFVRPISNLLLLDILGFVSIAYVVTYAVSYAVAKYFRYKPRTESLFSLVFLNLTNSTMILLFSNVWLIILNRRENLSHFTMTFAFLHHMYEKWIILFYDYNIYIFCVYPTQLLGQQSFSQI